MDKRMSVLETIVVIFLFLKAKLFLNVIPVFSFVLLSFKEKPLIS